MASLCSLRPFTIFNYRRLAKFSSICYYLIHEISTRCPACHERLSSNFVGCAPGFRAMKLIDVFRRLRTEQFIHGLGENLFYLGVERVSNKLDDTIGTPDRDVLEVVPTVFSPGRLRTREHPGQFRHCLVAASCPLQVLSAQATLGVYGQDAISNCAIVALDLSRYS
jgi:hypothetical protein